MHWSQRDHIEDCYSGWDIRKSKRFEILMWQEIIDAHWEEIKCERRSGKNEIWRAWGYDEKISRWCWEVTCAGQDEAWEVEGELWWIEEDPSQTASWYRALMRQTEWNRYSRRWRQIQNQYQNDNPREYRRWPWAHSQKIENIVQEPSRRWTHVQGSDGQCPTTKRR